MAILKGVTIKGSEEVHQLDYDKAIANKPTLVKSFNDLEDKPFYSERREVDILAKADYEFAKADGDNLYMSYPTFVLEPTTNYIVEWDGVTYTLTSSEIIDGGCVLGNFTILGAGDDTGEPFIIVYVEDISYLMTEDTSTSHNVRIYQSKEVIQYLDPKFIKDMYSSETSEVDILAKADYEFTLPEESPLYVCTNATFSLKENETYIVEWDGTTYSCTCTVIDGVTIGGNLGIIGGEDTEEPFTISYNASDDLPSVVMTSDTSASHNVRIYQIGEVVHPIPSKYVDSYTKAQMDEMLGVYVDEVNTLLGGDE